MDAIYIKFLQDEIERLTAELDKLTRVNIVCVNCGSSNVLLATGAYWDVEKQEYEVVNIFGDGHTCNDCNSGYQVKEVPLV